MHDVRDLGIREVVAPRDRGVGPGPIYLTVDVDVLDPAFIPRHRHAGARRHDRGRPAARASAPSPSELDLVGADVVEVIPTASAPPTTRRWSPSASSARR